MRKALVLFVTIGLLAGTASAQRLRMVKSSTPLGTLNAKLIFLADQLENNLPKFYKGFPVAVTSFVNVNNFSCSNTLGRLITESLIHELQVRGWNVLDLRLAKYVMMNSRGEFILTRNYRKVKSRRVKFRAVVTGTYFLAGDKVVVNARVIDMSTQKVLSSAQVVIPVEGMESLVVSDFVPTVTITQ